MTTLEETRTLYRACLELKRVTEYEMLNGVASELKMVRESSLLASLDASSEK